MICHYQGHSSTLTRCVYSSANGISAITQRLYLARFVHQVATIKLYKLLCLRRGNISFSHENKQAANKLISIVYLISAVLLV